MAKKNDLKNSMSAGLTGGLDSLIQSTAGQKEAQKPKKAKTVHCNFVMDETYLEKPRDFDPFGHAGFAHLWLQYD